MRKLSLGLLAVIWGVIMTGCGAKSASAPALNAALFDPPRTLTDFSAEATGGETFTLSQHQGELILLYFGYRTCPDFCPTTAFELRTVYQALKQPADKLKVVFVTVDPERDDMTSLARYVGAFHPDFIALRPEGDNLQAIMRQFGVVAEKRPMGDSPESYLVDHTASIFLIGSDGKLHGQYLYGTPYEDIQSDLQKLLRGL